MARLEELSVEDIRKRYVDSPDPVCDLDYIPKVGRDADVEYALSNSFGVGGINAAVVLKRHDGV